MPIKLPPLPDFEEGTHIYRHPTTRERLAALTSVLRAAGISYNGGFAGGWWGDDDQAMLRGKRVHAACHYDDEGDLEISTVLESDRKYLEAWRSAKDFYDIKPLAIERPCMFEPLMMGCRPDLIAKGRIHGQKILLIVERKSGKIPYWTRYQLAGQQMMMPDPFLYTRIAIELHADGTWRVGGPWFASTFAADRAIVEAAHRIYRMKEENKAL